VGLPSVEFRASDGRDRSVEWCDSGRNRIERWCAIGRLVIPPTHLGVPIRVL